MSKEKQNELMADKVTYSSEMQRRGKYVRRIVEAVNYRGENDHEDLWSILYDFEKEITAGYRKMPENIGEFSDGYHTFNELYHHRAVLFSVICNMMPEKAWKSKLHDTGDMYDGMFIVGIETEQGQATYHYYIDSYWDMFKVKELEKAPKYDGHTPSDAIARIGNIKQSEGEWGLVVDYGESKKVECSVCEKQFFFMKKGQLNIDRMPYCPHCGANMKGGE